MAHIHLEDGAFTIQWIIVWFAIAIVILAICLFWLTRIKKIDNKAITIAAMCTAASFAIFQVNIPLFGGVHLNLTPLIGILAGPGMGSIIVLIVNVFSAMIGHGGWGMIGANLLVNMAEVTVAYGVYRALAKLDMGVFSRAGVATISGLFIGNVVMILIILVSGIQGVETTLVTMLYGLSLLAAVNMGVAVVEAFITGYVVSYVNTVRPDILGEVTRVAAKVAKQ